MIAKGEKENLNKKFSMYEFLYLSVVTIVYACTASLIVPFVRVYTNGITDIEYVRYAFAYIITSASFILAVKTPYNSLANTAGRFKETRRGAWLEAFSNLIISLILVFKFGIVGVAIGTLISVIIRGIELIVFTNRNVLERNILVTLKKIITSVIQLGIITIISHYAFNLSSISYLAWIILAFKVFAIAIIIVVPSNIIFYNKDFKELIYTLKGVVKWRKK